MTVINPTSVPANTASFRQGLDAAKAAAVLPNLLWFSTDTGEWFIANAAGNAYQSIGRTSASAIAMGAFGNISYGVSGNDFLITDTNGASFGGIAGSADVGSTNANLRTASVGGGLKVKEGANAKQGTAVLVGGTVTVANTNVTANSRIFLTSNVDGGAPGFVRVSARVAGTSFTITSSSGTDTSTIAWEIFEPG